MHKAIVGQSFILTHIFGRSLATARTTYVKFIRPRDGGEGMIDAEVIDQDSGEIRARVSAGLIDQLGIWKFMAAAEYTDDDIAKSGGLEIQILSEGSRLR